MWINIFTWIFTIQMAIGFPSFEEFGRIYNKTYSYREVDSRARLYYSNLAMITAHNSNPLYTYKLGVNEWADMSWYEFARQKLVLETAFQTLSEKATLETVSKTISVPLTIDWVTLGKVNPIRNQGNCGSCWAFSAVSSIETAVSIKTGILPKLSEQQLVDCDSSNYGCSGGLMSTTFNYVTKNGITLLSTYPYIGNKQQCNTTNIPYVRIKGYSKVSPTDVSITRVVSNQPVSAGIEVDTLFRFYKSGIYNKGTCTKRLNHAVNIVGYMSNYWIVRNSWGSDWGENGYIRMIRNRNICGINQLVSYPVV